MALEVIEGGRMSDQVTSGLLGSIPRGETLKDPREGQYDAPIIGNELVQNTTGSYAILAEFGPLTDSEGKDFTHKERFNIPEPHSDVQQKRMFLSSLHDLGIVDRNDKQAVYCATDDDRAALLAAFDSKRGESFPFKLTEQNGFLRLRLFRKRA